MDELLYLIVTLIVIHHVSSKTKLYYIKLNNNFISKMPMKYNNLFLIPFCGLMITLVIYYFPSLSEGLIFIIVYTLMSICLYLTIQPIVNSLPLHSFIMKKGVSITITLIIVLVYINNPNWWLTNIIAICIAISIQTLLSFDKVHIPLVLVIGLFVYDLIRIFRNCYIPFYDGQSVLKGLSKNSTAYRIPLYLEFYSMFSAGHFIIGLGDIIFPGMFITHLYCIDFLFKTHYFLISVIGYCFGMIGTILLIWNYQIGIPVLLCIVPAMIILSLIYSIITKTLKSVINLSLQKRFELLSQKLKECASTTEELTIQISQ
ncbi:signal peptide peptidase family protein [Entamoeba histolytica HM-1:IMSS-B]|uniref:Signal peptide peptidase family protein n=6 Tax=Entamoeba histolytica TaxID=5759 RepID=C4LY30_ENTH1|nr:signal peptide peptidase family protein [Entamoeba histolytica HM-1:IMSS]EMD49216.1 signal peptide peptidase family protein [Entamoeba histolytica KU27]EMH75223.1 signal peptide peptidase family protein [Entamoeba histolytica HM-1:IMSS-B]EMS17400.1 signal peptide peptidase family protein [Entamoeba histolytica HM-3:IMSS]ENY64485.1 signal peptide peptidase family protein, putative [Entamoeba histolytica HM-1:IMSS-A]GAT93682.1 signal peptide peptidase family protein [Entamoeba histolytica]|eukprot:XP_652820.1 signal peptide peptidase family protein [Entamoeba histolytica HM-1:IMSS]